MITVNKRIEVLNGQPPFQVHVNALATKSITRTSERVFQINLSYAVEEDIHLTDTVTVFDGLGCVFNAPLGITNPCDEFYVSEIQVVDTTYSIISNEEELTYSWSIDDPEYYQIIGEGASINLIQTANGIQQTMLRLTVTNNNGCEKIRNLQLFPCRVLAKSGKKTLTLKADTTYEGVYDLSASSSCVTNNAVDWSTLQLENNTGLTVVQAPNSPRITITSPTPFNPTSIYFTVADSTGIRSNRARVEIDHTGSLASPDSTDPGFYPIVIPVDNDTTIINIPLNNLGLSSDIALSSLTINNALTTAISASISSGTLLVDMTGQQIAAVGLNAQLINGPAITPSSIVFVRDLQEYSPNTLVIFKGCSNETVNISGLDVTIAKVLGVQQGVNVNLLPPASIQFLPSSELQELTLNVESTSGQIGELKVNVCTACGIPDIEVTVCTDTVRPSDYVGQFGPNGTWTTGSGPGGYNTIPATFDEVLNIPTLGTYQWNYAIPNVITQSGYDCPDYDVTVRVTKVATTDIANNACATPALLGSVNNTQTLTSTRNISTSCSNRTTYSGNNGNLAIALYDQWFTFESLSTPPGGGATPTLSILVTVEGFGSTPIVGPQIQLWSGCVTPLVATQTKFINKTTLLYTIPVTGEIVNYLLQVQSDYTGDYFLTVSQQISA